MDKITRTVRDFGGYLIDFADLMRQNFEHPHSYTKFKIINSIRKKRKARILIETGTYLGVMAERCSGVFDKVYTIELDKDLARKAELAVVPIKNIQVLQGDAKNWLPVLLEKEKSADILLFLDAHFSGGVTACGDLPEPALEELKIIARFKDKVQAIVIDDFRSFGVEPGFPNKSDLLRTVEEFFLGDFKISIFLDMLLIQREKS